MSTELALNLGPDNPPDPNNGAEPLAVALIGPAEERRWAVAKALVDSRRASVREFTAYPAGRDEFQLILEQSFDIIVIDLDSDPDLAQQLVEQAGANRAATVMVYSEKADTKLAVRFMRAGAREFLLLPLEQGIVAEALARTAVAVRPKARPATEKAQGKVLVLLGAKGGSGVTTVACNLAISLARESGRSTLLIDLAAPIGDAALTLGLAPDYSTEDALQNAARLDGNFLQRILVKHSSGLFVLAAPSTVPEVEASKLAIDKLIAVARRNFDHVVVDVGSRIELAGTALFKEATTVYLVTLTGISDLRNSNRLISQFFTEVKPRLEIVVNRYEPRLLGGVREEVVAQALGRPVQWKIPEDQDAARETKAGETGQAKTRISRLTLEMASAINGHAVVQEKPEKKKGFGFRGFGRSIADKVSGNDDLASMSIRPPATPRPAPTMSIVPPAPVRQAPTLPAAPPPRPVAAPSLSIAPPPAKAPAIPSAPVAPPPPMAPAASTTSVAPPPRPHAAPTMPPAPPVKMHAAPSISITSPARPPAPPMKDRATPSISWPTPRQIIYGESLTTAQLNAAASVAGTFEYYPAIGEMLQAGMHTLSVTFTPANTNDYAATQATVPLNVLRATPALKWSDPAPIVYGEQLSSIQLGATSSMPGSFDYSPSLGELLPAGTHTLSVHFTPADDMNCATAQATVTLDVSPATPAISWSNPAPITFGTPLSDMQLSANASVPGSLDYFPAPGEILPAGTHPISVIFTPADSANYAAAQASVSLHVAVANVAIEWSNPESITYGRQLSNTQLNAMAPVPGKFEYSPSLGKVLTAGTHPISVVFIPADSVNVATAQATVSLDVARAVPAITWSTHEAISYNTPLSAQELCATASVPGTFNYSPAPGEVLPPGTHTLSAIFTPLDSENYAPARATITLNVTRATPVIDWSKPDPVTYGTALGPTQLCATASVPGTFEFSPKPFEVLSPGTHKLSVTFTPSDSANYATAQATVSLNVSRVVPVIDWPKSGPITHGTPLSAAILCATASEPGTFDYSPALGEVLAAGTHTLSVIFTPADSAHYATAETTVSISVAKATPTITWSRPEPIPYGTVLGNEQLSATASVQGRFDYSPAPGDVLPPGKHTLSVAFIPADSVNCEASEATVPLDVTAATPFIAWSNPDPIAHGSGSQHSTAWAPSSFAHSGADESLESSMRPFSPRYAAPADAMQANGTDNHHTTETSARETRVYKGAVYEKGEDGKWHLQQI